MALNRNLLKDVLGLEDVPNSVLWRDAESGIRYYIPSDTQGAAIYQNLSTPQEQEAFAKANYTFTLEYDDEKNLKRVEKGPTWGKTHRRKPNQTTINSATTATDGPTTGPNSSATDSPTTGPNWSTTATTN